MHHLEFFHVLGKGLGKNEDGISQAIKPTLKFDNAGIGYKETFNENWWQAHFDNAAKNIKVESHEDQVSLSVIDNKQDTISSKKGERTELSSKYPNLVKAATHIEVWSQLHIDDSEKFEKNEATTNLVNTSLTDEQLYKACDGRTVHKTARHGLTLSGKLERIAQQDNMLLGMQSTHSFTHLTTNTTPIFQHDPFKMNNFKPKFLSDVKNDYTEKISNLSKKLSTCHLKTYDAEYNHEAPRNKRKRNQDCIIRIDPLETEDVFFFRKKQKTSLEQIEVGIKRMNIEQKTNEQEIEPSNACYETKKRNKLKKPRGYIGSQCLELADMWNNIKIGKEEAKPLEYLTIKKMLEKNEHLDLINNIEKCIIEHPWIITSLRKLYFTNTSTKKINAILKIREKFRKKREQEGLMRQKKICTQTHFTPV